MSQATYDAIKAKLDAAGIEYKTHTHAPVTTSEEAARVRGVKLEEGAKALIIRDSKTKEHVLCVMPAHLRLDTKKLREHVSKRTSFAKDPEELVDCKPGSVPPFGSVLGLKTICDARLSASEHIHFNAGLLTESITMRYEDYAKAEQPLIADITEDV